MNLKNIMLTERKQTQNITYCTNPFRLNIQNRQIYRQKAGKCCLGLGEYGGKGNWSDCHWREVFWGMMETV